MQWTLLAPYIVGCPENNTRVQFQNFPALNITNNPNVSALALNATPAASRNETSFTTPGQAIYLEWESPGKQVGPNNSYTTNTTAGEAKVRSCSFSLVLARHHGSSIAAVLIRAVLLRPLYVLTSFPTPTPLDLRTRPCSTHSPRHPC